MASLSAEKMGLFQSWASSWWTVFRGKPYPCPLQSLMGQFVIRYDLHIPHTLLLHKQKEIQKLDLAFLPSLSDPPYWEHPGLLVVFTGYLYWSLSAMCSRPPPLCLSATCLHTGSDGRLGLLQAYLTRHDILLLLYLLLASKGVSHISMITTHFNRDPSEFQKKLPIKTLAMK